MSPTLLHPARLLDAVLDLIYPRRCGGCERLGPWLCEACLAEMAPPAIIGWVCGHCGQALAATDGGWDCPRRCTGDGLTAVLGAGAYAGPLREAIHHLKYDGWRVLAPALGNLLAATCTTNPLPWPATARPTLVPVPLHPQRERERGFNQAALLARQVAARLDWPVARGLARVRPTQHQVGLTAAERALNLEEAFAWRGATPPPAGPLVLVDDVYTTGATLFTCAEALQAAGAGAVYGLTLARRDQSADPKPGPLVSPASSADRSEL